MPDRFLESIGISISLLHLFPTAYPDELLYSVVCRYHVRSGNITVQQTRSDLSFLNNGNSYSHILPSKLGHLSKQLPFASSLTVEQLIENHTLFPYYPGQTHTQPDKILSK
ncbi:TniQ family protein [Cyanobacterium sp. IPPAS B-1200]|uniref:TniQ family protein n=1 Tax=Cyanobacterium sp. IPPAS B-1200 TaxID=1562720 RepID=UPI003D44DE33